MAKLRGYAGQVLRVDLGNLRVFNEPVDEAVLLDYVGGTGLGLKYLYDEVPPRASWADPINRLIIASGPFGGTQFSGTGTISVVAKGAMSNMVAATQANGFIGAFLKFCGYDAIVFQGAADDWVYLHVDDKGAELRDARFLLGKDTWETQEAIEQTDPERRYSVFSIGPAGENLVRFAAIAGDRGHVAPHNGVGAVLGSKKCKGIAVARGKRPVPVFDRNRLSAINKRAFAAIIADPAMGMFYRWGTGGHFSHMHAGGLLPVNNYTTSIFPEHERNSGIYTREHFKNEHAPCWACRVSHCRITTVTEGRYAGYVGDEPEYEGFATCASLIGQTDPGATVMLSNLIDRLGLDLNESGWIVGFVMECFEKGLLTKADTGGLELCWGNAEAAATLLRQIARREGFGARFADGVQLAARQLGAQDLAVYTAKGSSPRGHDHRAKWDELLDTCVGNTGTVESGPGAAHVGPLGIEPIKDKFSWQEVSTFNAKVNGWRQWVDTLGVCSFNYVNPADLVDAYSAITGLEYSIPEALTAGRRLVNRMRVYNLRCGLTPDMEEPSARYSSTPVDGPAAGKSIRDHWPEMRRNYYLQMGWDGDTGRPTPETLRALGLNDLVADLS